MWSTHVLPFPPPPLPSPPHISKRTPRLHLSNIRSGMEYRCLCWWPLSQQHVASLFTDVIDDGLKFQRDNLTEPIPTVNVQLLASLTKIFSAMFVQAKWDWSKSVGGECS
jgi:hypothetical protein